MIQDKNIFSKMNQLGVSSDIFNLNPIFKIKPNKSDFPFVYSVDWHGVLLTFYLESFSFHRVLSGYFPKGWERQNFSEEQLLTCDVQEIFIFDPEKYKVSKTLWQNPDPGCKSFINNELKWSVQRDFICVQPEDRSWVQALTINDLDDGFFNLMRFLLPRLWLPKNKFLLHSSCVVDSLGQAYLCLGPSGAGKTTISSFLPEDQVLGDDMNLIFSDVHGHYFVTPSLVGQRIQNPSLFGNRYPLKRIFWLEKDDANHLYSDKVNHLPLRLYGSLVNLIWNELGSDDIDQVQKFIKNIQKTYQLENLKFSLKGDVWSYVFSE